MSNTTLHLQTTMADISEMTMSEALETLETMSNTEVLDTARGLIVDAGLFESAAVLHYIISSSDLVKSTGVHIGAKPERSTYFYLSFPEGSLYHTLYVTVTPQSDGKYKHWCDHNMCEITPVSANGDIDYDRLCMFDSVDDFIATIVAAAS